MRKRALLAVIVVLLLIGAYGAYVVSYPRYPEVKGCVNPFAVTKPVSRVQENWSTAHVFLKLVTSKDFWKLAKPWDVDYSHVKIVKHTIEYNGEKITMLAMGIPLKDKKHVIALYEFSKPVQEVKERAFLFEIEGTRIKAESLSTNGYVTTLTSCSHECSSSDDCGFLERCEWYPCSTNWDCAIRCCLTGGSGLCTIPCVISRTLCIACIAAACPLCVDYCSESGTKCVPITPGP
ncbi:hypothetical protein [Thermococcus sp.]|uniref:hypothetical protein n=1 Tax=Thermococcus sp. TaxID=35749 RepID=UPI00262C2B90|nr:hypothetical protein [Thermococcus sp.]